MPPAANPVPGHPLGPGRLLILRHPGHWPRGFLGLPGLQHLLPRPFHSTSVCPCPPPPPEPCAHIIQDASAPFPAEALAPVWSLPSAAQFEVLFDCFTWLTAAWDAFVRHRATSTRFIVSIPIHLNGHVIWFYDDQPPPLQALDSAQASYRIASHTPGHRLWLSHSALVPSPAIWAW